MNIRKGRTVVYCLQAHLVLMTKRRGQLLDADLLATLKRYFSSVCSDFEVELVECGGGGDYVQMQVIYPPKVSLAKLINSLKGVSSRMLRHDQPEAASLYYDGALWSPSYFVASSGAPLWMLKKYLAKHC